VSSVDPMPTRILLVRHGQSEWNAAGRWQGQQDPPLTDLGRRQALAAADTIGSIEAVFASDLQRAMETATIIASKIGVLPVLVDAGFRERCAGEWEGLTRAEIEAAWPGYLDAPGDAHVGFATSTPRRPPSWESDEELVGRAVAALARVNEHVGNGHALVVTHGGLIYAIEAHLGQPLGTTGRLANGAGREVVVDDDGLHLGERFLLVNDDATPVTVPDQI
jgi:broad specificity phosphatase PhoE